MEALLLPSGWSGVVAWRPRTKAVASRGPCRGRDLRQGALCSRGSAHGVGLGGLPRSPASATRSPSTQAENVVPARALAPGFPLAR